MSPIEQLNRLISLSPAWAKRVSIVQESPQHFDYPNGFSVSGDGPPGPYSYGGQTIEDALGNAVAAVEGYGR